MEKRKQSDRHPRPESKKRSEKHKASDTRWRTNVAKSFQSLKDAVQQCNPNSPKPANKKKTRASILNETVTCVKTLEQKIQELCKISNDRKRSENDKTWSECLNLDYFRNAFDTLENDLNPCTRNKVLDQNYSAERENEILRKLSKLKVNNDERNGKPASQQLHLKSNSTSTTLSSICLNNTIPAPYLSFLLPIAPSHNFQSSTSTYIPQANANTGSNHNDFELSSCQSSFSFSCDNSTSFTPTKTVAKKVNKSKIKFTKPRLASNVRRRLNMDSVNEIIYQGNKSDDGPQFKEDELFQFLPITNQTDKTSLPDDLKDIILQDLGPPEVNLDDLKDISTQDLGPPEANLVFSSEQSESAHSDTDIDIGANTNAQENRERQNQQSALEGIEDQELLNFLIDNWELYGPDIIPELGVIENWLKQ
ncbi:hypothetical protein B4U79_17797 [Dinothrombium tinctorium]|uniref:BHLH domain-containing protein n=1 Tax=Dinothrombium tinctorium TaxID=1965070 RepID=A0A443QZ02_9ACAR|nr:hypothetical protein B4U79_17797 [Dinothrombium tinctorium]